MARYSRLIYEECMKWVSLRKAFGKPLSEQPVIRAKLGAMLANVDAGQAYLERELHILMISFDGTLKSIPADLTYQM